MATFLLTLEGIFFIVLYLCARGTRGRWKLDPTDLKELNAQGKNVVKTLGCRKLYGAAILIKTHPMMTSLWCTSQCWEQKSEVALMKSTKCWCFNGEYPASLEVPESECTTPCPGSNVEICGGNNVASAMDTGFVPFVESNIDSLYDRLVSEMNVNRNYKNAKFVKLDPGSCVNWKPDKKLYRYSVRMTVKICVILCYYNKFIYAMLSNGNRCTCTSLNPPRQKGLNCDTKCKGDHSQICGGKLRKDWINSIYMTGRYNTKGAIFGKPVMAIEPLQQNWNPFLWSNQPIMSSFGTANRFELQTPGPMNVTIEEKKESALVTTSITLGVVLIVVMALCVCIFLGIRHRNKAPDYAALEEKEKLREYKKTRKGGRISQRGDRSRRQDSSREAERRA